MFYEFVLAVPANTAKAAPAELEVPLDAGAVVGVSVQFPRGCRGEVQVAIFRSNHQVWPGDPDTYISGDDAIVPWVEDYDLDDVPYSFLLRGWSPTTRFAHNITFRFNLLPLDTARAQRGAGGLLARVARMLGVR